MATDFFGNNVNVGNTLKCGALRKFIVIKEADAIEYLNYDEKTALEDILVKINNKRAENQRKCDNEYFVINTDEPYAGEIIEILKRNGHWGDSKETIELETCNGCEKEYNPKISGGVVNGHPFCQECMEGMAEDSARLSSLIGFPPEGSHTDEWNPRAETWHEERLNWQAEVKMLQDHIRKNKPIIEMLKNFAFVNPDESLTDRCDRATDVQKLLRSIGHGEWVDQQIEINKAEAV